MAGLIHRKGTNVWTATFNVAGKETRRTTGIHVEPPPGLAKKAHEATKREQKAKAQIIANQLEAAAKGGKVDAEQVKAIAGERKGKQLLRGKQYMQGVADYLEGWKRSRTESTRERDAIACRLFLEFLRDAKNMPLDCVTRDHAHQFMMKQLERVASGTVGQYIAYLRTAFNAAIRAEIITANPFARLTLAKRDKQDKQERRAFTIEECRQLLAVLPGEWGDMIRVCLYTGGQRLGDIATMKWEQIDVKEWKRLTITPKKKTRPMNKPIIAPLRATLERLHKNRVNAYVFPIAAMKHNQTGKSSKLSTEFTDLLDKHGFIEPKQRKQTGAPDDRRHLSELSFHSFRATAVTVLRNAGVPVDLCRFIIGHDSEEIERVYYRPDGEAVAEAMKPLEQIDL